MGAESKMTENDNCVIFDGQCPFCRAYVASLEGKNENNQTGLNKIDARHASELVEQLIAQDVDINAGIVFIKGERVYQGAEALTLLARQHTIPGWFANLHHRFLRYRPLSFVLYPILRLLRNTYLRLAGRSVIESEVKLD